MSIYLLHCHSERAQTITNNKFKLGKHFNITPIDFCTRLALYPKPFSHTEKKKTDLKTSFYRRFLQRSDFCSAKKV